MASIWGRCCGVTDLCLLLRSQQLGQLRTQAIAVLLHLRASGVGIRARVGGYCQDFCFVLAGFSRRICDFTCWCDCVQFLLPPSKVIALVDYVDKDCARKAFRALSFKRYLDAPLLLEFAPAALRIRPRVAERRKK